MYKREVSQKAFDNKSAGQKSNIFRQTLFGFLCRKIGMKVPEKTQIQEAQSLERIRKLPVPDHMTLVVKNEIITGCEEIGNFRFDSEDDFSLHIYRKTVHLLKTCAVNYKSITYCQTKFH